MESDDLSDDLSSDLAADLSIAMVGSMCRARRALCVCVFPGCTTLLDDGMPEVGKPSRDTMHRVRSQKTASDIIGCVVLAGSLAIFDVLIVLLLCLPCPSLSHPAVLKL